MSTQVQCAPLKIIRKHLETLVAENLDETHTPICIGQLASSLLVGFKKCWKNGTDPVYTEAQNGEPAVNGQPVMVLGARKRQMGIHPILTLATFLDPRYKNLGSIDLASLVRCLELDFEPYEIVREQYT